MHSTTASSLSITTHAPTKSIHGLRRFENADLRARNSFGVTAYAPLLVEVEDAALLPQALAADAAGAQALVLGGGSNLLFAGNPTQGIVTLTGARMLCVREHGDYAVVRAEAGAVWHRLVMWTLEQGLSGLENLALIPGTVGAAPIQNIGAYGVELSEHVHAVEAYERASGQTHRLDRSACRFGYRDSLFKHAPDAWIVTAVELRLPRRPQLRLDYAGIGAELASMGVQDPTPSQVAEAVTRIRRRKLPDPAQIGNAGSFFKNPIVASTLAADLRAEHPTMPIFQSGRADACKLSAAWLIEQCGWKGYRDGDVAVSAQHALVLVNHGSASGLQLLDLAGRIAASVQQRFGVVIEPEPRIISATAQEPATVAVSGL